MGYILIGLSDEPDDLFETPVRVEQWWDRHGRSWVTILVNAAGQQVGDAMFDGERTGAAVSKATMQKRLDEHRAAREV